MKVYLDEKQGSVMAEKASLDELEQAHVEMDAELNQLSHARIVDLIRQIDDMNRNVRDWSPR